MYKSLLNLFNNTFENDIMECIDGVNNALSNYHSKFEEVENENTYMLVLNVPSHLKSTDINVEYDEDNRKVTISTKYGNENVSYSMKATETLPIDADVETMSATVSNGVFCLVVDKLPVPETDISDVEETTEPMKVTIKRKKKE